MSVSTERKKFAARLNDVLDEAGLPKIGQGRQSALGKLLDVPPQQAGRWLKGEDFPKTSQLVKLAQHVGVRSNWLLSGAGEKGAPAEGEEVMREPAVVSAACGDGRVARGATGPAPRLNQDAFDFALTWMKLPLAQRDALRRLVVELARDL